MGLISKTLLILTIVFATSCSQKPAQIVNNHRVIYSKANKPRSVVVTNRKLQDDNQIEVSSGDTIFGISRKYQIPLRDLISHNNLVPPYILKTGDHLIIPSTTYHEVKTGETLYAISRLYNMQINQLIALNHLEEPYNVKVGDRIKISNSEKNPKPTIENKDDSNSKKPNLIERTLDRFNHFSWPIKGPIISDFGPKSGGLYNDGINIKAKEGSEVKASEDGVVAYVGNELKGYGNLVIIKHGGGWITAYAHLAKTNVKRGQKVQKGQVIATVGSTGKVTSPQLYFGLRKGRDAVNPRNHLR